MSLLQKRALSLLVFYGVILVVAGIIVIYDVWVAYTRGESATISAALRHMPPLVVAITSFAVGGTVFGLMVHFWAPPPPSTLTVNHNHNLISDPLLMQTKVDSVEEAAHWLLNRLLSPQPGPTGPVGPSSPAGVPGKLPPSADIHEGD